MLSRATLFMFAVNVTQKTKTELMCAQLQNEPMSANVHASMHETKLRGPRMCLHKVACVTLQADLFWPALVMLARHLIVLLTLLVPLLMVRVRVSACTIHAAGSRRVTHVAWRALHLSGHWRCSACNFGDTVPAGYSSSFDKKTHSRPDRR